GVELLQQVEQDAVVPRQVIRGLRRVVVLQVRGRCHRQPAGQADLTGNQAAVLEVPDPQRNVYAFTDQVDILVAELQVN
nr:hypothetical protein [Tanacetum cinerariifolium]